MRSKTRSKAILLGAVGVLSIAAAQNSSAHRQGWYVGGEVGAVWIDDTSFSYSNNEYDFYKALDWSSWDSFSPLDFDTGWAGFATLGYGFEKNWRVELEVGYRQNDFDLAFPERGGGGYDIAIDLPESRSISGDVTEWTVMANVIYDVPLTERLDLNLGVGLGVDFVDAEVAGLSDDDTRFAWQGIVGLSYEVSNRLDLTLTYRYLNVDAPSFSATTGPVQYPITHTVGLEDLEKHTVTIGLRYDLHEDVAPLPPAPPPPPPPPPSAAPQQFIVYFGFNKCNITAEANDVLGEAAKAASTHGSVSILITGHTDTVGSNAYNQELSECRADAAKSNLVNKGIPAGSITTTGKGEGELMVKTGDNVKEPQNRRATVDLNH